MSTGINNIKLNRFAQIAQLGGQIFHTNDLANLWQIKDKNLLYTTLTRYVKQGLLFRIYRGFYGLKPADQLDPLLLGLKALHQFAYISTETVLARAGIIFQVSDQITFVSRQNKKFSIGPYHYYSRQLADQFLYNPAGVTDDDGIKTASPARAVADLLYLNPTAHLDASRLINWRQVKQIQRAVGYPLTPKHYVAKPSSS